MTIKHNHGRGKIKDNALKALVTSPVFKSKTMKNKKGKGSYQRCEKHRKAYKNESPFKSNLQRAFLNGLFLI